MAIRSPKLRNRIIEPANSPAARNSFCEVKGTEKDEYRKPNIATAIANYHTTNTNSRKN